MLPIHSLRDFQTKKFPKIILLDNIELHFWDRSLGCSDDQMSVTEHGKSINFIIEFWWRVRQLAERIIIEESPQPNTWVISLSFDKCQGRLKCQRIRVHKIFYETQVTPNEIQ